MNIPSARYMVFQSRVYGAPAILAGRPPLFLNSDGAEARPNLKVFV